LGSRSSNILGLDVHRHHHHLDEELVQAAGMDALDARIREVANGASAKDAPAETQGSLA